MTRLVLGFAAWLWVMDAAGRGAWAADADRPRMTSMAPDAAPFEYVEVGAKIPDYKQGKGKTLGRMQKPLSPLQSMKHLVHPVDFELRLFASEELLGGRLWVAVTVDYPNELQPAGRGRDRILIVEDGDGDGRADRSQVFADQLSIPTSLLFARGGVIVHQAPDTLFLRDTDGNDTADEHQVLFSGWGTRDSHAGPSNLQYGLDNWVYGIVGYSGFEGSVGGEEHRFGQGFYRFAPDGSKLEFLRSTSNNSWGIGCNEEGDLFGSTANGNPSVHLPIPNRYYERVRGWSSGVLGTIAEDTTFYPITDRVRQVDQHGRFTSAAGHALYTARTYPREYWNRTAFVADPTGHLVATFTLQPHGSSYRSRNAWNLLAGQDEWCAPIAAEVGPDGNVWVIDWYAYIVQHNPTPPGFTTGQGNAYETDLRDTKHGRIYRLVARNGQPAAPLSLQNASAERLVATLTHDNLFWRRHAQRLIVERADKDVVPALLELVGDRTVDPIGSNVRAIHALWTLHGLGALDGSDGASTKAAAAALRHPSAGVRRNAAQVLPPDQSGAILDAGLLKDADLRVRLAALLRLAEILPSPGAALALVDVLRDNAVATDHWLLDALTIAAAAHAPDFLPALATTWTGPLTAEGTALVERVAEHCPFPGRPAPTRYFLPHFSHSTAMSTRSLLGIESVGGASMARRWMTSDRPPQFRAQRTGDRDLTSSSALRYCSF